MQTECVRCHKAIDTVQGYKFSATEYVCMSCYDEFKAERAAKAKKQHKNPLLDRYGAEAQPPVPQGVQPQPAAPPAPTAPTPPQPQLAPAPPQPAAQAAPQQQMFTPRSAPAEPAAPQVGGLKAAAPPKPKPSAEICDVCQKPIPDFKVPLKGGRKVCMGCNDLLREVAKSLAVNIQCPHCGKDVQISGE
jgi:DNA-directed RNA polymerase subunit RPC12/RpoP